jgi:Ca2+:H+ antiporter
MIVYISSLIFSLHTHKELFRGAPPEETGPEKRHAAWNLPVALLVLGLATFFIAWLSEILVGSVEQAALRLGMSKVFVGLIIVAVIGNAAEHSTAVMAAMKNRMDLSVGIAIGSSTQVALFLTPLLVFLSYLMAPQRLDLVFTKGQVFAIVISASLVAHTTGDGKSNWFTGLLLLTVYLALAVGFFHVPG